MNIRNWIIVASVMGILLMTGCRSTGTKPPEDVTAIERIDAAEPELEALSGKRVAVLIADGFHDGETIEPIQFLTELGAEITVIGSTSDVLTAYNSDVTVAVERGIDDIRTEDFDALIIPGGRSPATLRTNESIVSFVAAFAATEKPIAAICHGPQVLITAGIMENRRSTGFSGIADELREAGALFEDSVMVRDGNIITSRNPNDIPAFNSAIRSALLETTSPEPL